MRALVAIDLLLLRQHGHLFVWSPVFLALGIGAYFGLEVEPGLGVYAVLGIFGTGFAATALRWPGGWSVLGWALALMAAGFTLAGLRAHNVGDPVLGWRYYGPIEGRVFRISASSSWVILLTSFPLSS